MNNHVLSDSPSTSNSTPSNSTPSNSTPSNSTPSNSTPSNSTPSNSIPSLSRSHRHHLSIANMDKDSEKSAEPILDAKPHQDPVSSAVNEYLGLVNHSTQSSQLGFDQLNDRNAIFKDIKVWGGNSESKFLETVTNIFLLPVTLIQKVFSHKKPVEKMILHEIDGFVPEGEMLLVLGRPGSGCTTLLKTLSGFTETFHGLSGEVAYFGLPIAEVKKRYRGDLVYNAEGLFLPRRIWINLIHILQGTFTFPISQY
jgi:ABC-type glutathione transport system ATPase component